ncbi:PerC family transcriptional regulator [Raoultella ornithinolytica]
MLGEGKRQPARAEDFGGLHKAAGETQHRMGIAKPNGEAFRLKTSR